MMSNQHAICDTWKALTHEGNAHFHAQAYMQALAYYLRYQNKRPEYIAAFYHVVNWAEVERRWLEATKS